MFYRFGHKYRFELTHKCDEVGHGFMNGAAEHARVKVLIATLHLAWRKT